MRPFVYKKVTTVEGAINSIRGDARFLGGGTNLVDLMKTGTEQPSELVDISRVPLMNIEEQRNGGLRIGATVRNSALANHPVVRQRYPVLAQALLSGASPQIRNMATVGGNLLQRTRCYYFYDPSYVECNKRTPGSGCAALQGQNRMHVILGGSESCIATHPSDMAVAMMALDAVVRVQSASGEHAIPLMKFYRLPGTTPHIETELKRDEMIVGIDLPPVVGPHSHYLKVRDRNSYAFALVSVAAVMDVEAGNKIREARIALGGVAPRPWRIPEAEKALAGQTADEAAFKNAADILLKDAKGQRHNGFKVELARRSIVRALTIASTPRGGQ